MMNGFIKPYRSLLDWDWIAEPNTLSVFIQLLLRARFVNGHWKGVSIESGQLITSLKSLSSATGLSIQSVRTSLKHLESTGEITVKVTNKYRIITVTNWGKYQTISPSATNKSTDYLTDSQQVANRHLADNQQQRKNEEKRKVVEGEEREEAQTARCSFETKEEIQNGNEKQEKLNLLYIELEAVTGICSESDRLKINTLAENYSIPWVEEAIRRTGDATYDKRNWRYINSIIRSWKKLGHMDAERNLER